MLAVFFLVLTAAAAFMLGWRRSARLRNRVKTMHAFATGLVDGLRGHTARPRRLVKRAAARTVDEATHDAQGRLMIFVLVLLHPSDYELLAPMELQHRQDLEEELERRARTGGLRTLAAPRVEFAVDASAWRGHPRVRVEFLTGTLLAFTQEFPVATLEPLTARLPALRLPQLTQVLGRSASRSDLVVPDPRVSRAHCSISRDEDGNWTIEDLGSHNYTFVNGVQVEMPTALQPGDTIGFGEYVNYRFVGAS